MLIFNVDKPKCCLLLSAILLLGACASNDICIDKKNNTVCGVDCSITLLYIVKGENWLMIENVSLHEARKCIPFNQKTLPGYVLEKKGEVFTTKNTFFPDSQYEITNVSVGDADGHTIIFDTDSLGNIITPSR